MNRVNSPFIALFVIVMALCGMVASAQNTERVTPPPAVKVVTPAAVEETLPGDAEAGEVLFTTFQPAAGIACSTCHRIDTDERLIGPGLLHVGERAITRIEDYTAADYIRESILEPGAYIVEGYPDIMPKNFSAAFTEDEINDLTAFLLTLAAEQ